MADRYLRREQGEKSFPRFELVVFRKDGEIRNVEINARVVKDPEGNANYIVFAIDVTEKKKMEDQLLQAEKLRALAEMASGVAHDFNNALAAILGNTQLLLYTVQDEEVKESLKIIEKVAKDSAKTVRRLQDFTRKRVHQNFLRWMSTQSLKIPLRLPNRNGRTRSKVEESVSKSFQILRRFHRFQGTPLN